MAERAVRIGRRGMGVLSWVFWGLEKACASERG